jgi:hypothetical protein
VTPIAASLSSLLGALGLSANVTVDVRGQLTVTLDTLTLFSTVFVGNDILATLDVLLDNAMLFSTGTVAVPTEKTVRLLGVYSRRNLDSNYRVRRGKRKQDLGIYRSPGWYVPGEVATFPIEEANELISIGLAEAFTGTP